MICYFLSLFISAIGLNPNYDIMKTSNGFRLMYWIFFFKNNDNQNVINLNNNNNNTMNHR